MNEEQIEFSEGRSDLETVKKMRREYPSGWLQLSKDPARALLIDALLDAPPEYEFSPPEIAPRTGITAQSVRNHIGTLVDLGLVEKSDTTRYRVNSDSRILMELEHLNSAVTAIRSGMADKTVSDLDPTEEIDNSQRDTDSTGRSSQFAYKNPGGVMNAD